MADGTVRAPADNTGKYADTTELTNAFGATVERIRVDVPDGMAVGGSLLELIYSEIRATNTLLAQAFGLDRDLETLRAQVGED